MKKQFVPYELALKLKELGFNEKCLGKYIENEEEIHDTYISKISLIITETKYNRSCIKAPLWQQAFDWFKENYNLYGCPEFIERNLWAAFVINIKTENIRLDREYNSYEEARLECLKKLIELVEN